jgi:hypothetical protein
MGTRNAYKLLVGTPERKRLVRNPKRRWVNNITVDLGKIGWGGKDLIGLVQDRDQWRIFERDNKPSGFIKC